MTEQRGVESVVGGEAPDHSPTGATDLPLVLVAGESAVHSGFLLTAGAHAHPNLAAIAEDGGVQRWEWFGVYEDRPHRDRLQLK